MTDFPIFARCSACYEWRTLRRYFEHLLCRRCWRRRVSIRENAKRRAVA